MPETRYCPVNYRLQTNPEGSWRPVDDTGLIGPLQIACAGGLPPVAYRDKFALPERLHAPDSLPFKDLRASPNALFRLSARPYGIGRS